MKSRLLKLRLLATLTAAAAYLAASPLVMAAEDEGEAAAEPVWVLSYASFLGFAAATIFLSLFFSRRKETALSNEEVKKAGQTRANRIKERRQAERYARVHAQKKR